MHCFILKCQWIFLAKNFNKLRKGADIVLLMSNGGDACGISYLSSITSGQTFGVVQRSCATGYYSFAHEIAHMYGCYHNRETSPQNQFSATAYGFWMSPPMNSTFRTILA